MSVISKNQIRRELTKAIGHLAFARNVIDNTRAILPPGAESRVFGPVLQNLTAELRADITEIQSFHDTIPPDSSAI